MDEREELVQELDKSREVLLELLADLPPDTEIYPGWTLRQFYAHLTGWDDVVTTALREHAAGRVPTTPVVNGINAYNAESIHSRKGLDDQQIVEEWQLARVELRAAIRDFPAEHLNNSLVFPWGPVGSVRQMVEVLVEHEGDEHANELRARKAQQV
jgi:uncharacterized protein (TIGR03083 family)